jgi:hypothetical protein
VSGWRGHYGPVVFGRPKMNRTVFHLFKIIQTCLN